MKKRKLTEGEEARVKRLRTTGRYKLKDLATMCHTSTVHIMEICKDLPHMYVSGKEDKWEEMKALFATGEYMGSALATQFGVTRQRVNQICGNYGDLRVEATCDQCGATFTKRSVRQRWCSSKCAGIYHWFRANPPKPMLTKTCPKCLQDFETRSSHRRFCSDVCRNRYHGMSAYYRRVGKPRPPVVRRKLACPECGKTFTTLSPRQKFCCTEHGMRYNLRGAAERKGYNLGPFPPRDCIWCGNTFTPKTSVHRCCCPSCRASVNYYEKTGRLPPKDREAEIDAKVSD